MHINTHTHLFTLHNVLSKEAVRAIGNRLRHKRVPEYFVEGLENLFNKIASKPKYLTEDELLEELVKSILSSDAFKDFQSNHIHEIPILNAIDLDSNKLGKTVLKQILNALSAWGEANDNSRSTLFDFYETFRIALMPNSTAIADEFLDHLEPNDAIVGLMMDIRGDSESDRDKKRFREQLSDLEEASLQRPGRVLPFFAVNPKRPDHYELMKDALENKGFIGVKLYPSIGYEVNHPDLLEVYDYCVKHDVPIVMHCNHGGFYVEENFTNYCDPEYWEPILQQLPDLKICFAHFGGEESLSKPGGLAGDSWGKKIIDLMEAYDGVYADVSYHDEMMSNADDEQFYLNTLTGLLDRDVVKERILFGTDSWMLRMNMADEAYWSYFRAKLSQGHFNQITQSNPKRFLGLQPLKTNIKRYINFQKSNRKNVGAFPATWLKQKVDKNFKVKRDHPSWTLQKYPALVVLAAIGNQLYSKQDEQAFARKAFITMRELKYWRFSNSNEGAFKQAAKKISLDLVNQCEHSSVDGSLEGTLTKNQARQELESMVLKADTKLLDIAIQIEVMYNFNYPSQ